MTLSEYEKLKQELLDAKEKALKGSITAAQSILYDELIENLLNELKGDQILNTSENISSLTTIDKVWKKFVETEIIPIMRKYVSDLREINTLNAQYFSVFSETKRIMGEIESDINKGTYERLGVNQQGGVIKGGYLDSLIRDDTVKNEVKKLTYKSIVSERVTKKEYIQSVRELIEGKEGKMGALDRHFDTFAYDTFTQHDRTVSWQYANKLGLKYAKYMGGLVEDSRPFCVVRNGKVFSADEILKFGTPMDIYGGYTNKSKGQFKGKPLVYDPVLDCGGYRCRHSLNFMTDKEAQRRRPDLF